MSFWFSRPFVEWEFLSDCAISLSLPTFTFLSQTYIQQNQAHINIVCNCNDSKIRAGWVTRNNLQETRKTNNSLCHEIILQHLSEKKLSAIT